MEIEKVLTGLNFIVFDEIKQQLNKDLTLCALELSQDSNTPAQLYKSLLALIQEESKHSSETIMNLLYRIDVAEKTIYEITQKYEVNFEEALAIGILNRTIQKVGFKKKFEI